MSDDESAGSQSDEAQENPEIQLPQIFFKLHRNDEFMMKEYRSLTCSEQVQDLVYHHDFFCPFLHADQTLRRRPYWFDYCPKLCPEIGNCPLGNDCNYSHNILEYSLHPKIYRRSNRCFEGERCMSFPCLFPHDPEKLRRGMKPPLHAPPRPRTPPLSPLPPLRIPPPRQGGRSSTFSGSKSI